LCTFMLSRKVGGGFVRTGALVLVSAVLGFAHFGFIVFGGNPNWVSLAVGISLLGLLITFTIAAAPGWGVLVSQRIVTKEASPK
jgi:hypothetical protein